MRSPRVKRPRGRVDFNAPVFGRWTLHARFARMGRTVEYIRCACGALTPCYVWSWSSLSARRCDGCTRPLVYGRPHGATGDVLDAPLVTKPKSRVYRITRTPRKRP